MPEPHVGMIVIQPTPFCNIDCRYCYLPNRQSTQQIRMETVSGIARMVFSSKHVGNPLLVLWHCGEPFTLTPAFYEEAFATIARANHKSIAIRHSLQTNGTLIDQEWCDLIARHDIQIGISVDGPAFLNDAQRVDRAGRGTFDRVARGMRLFRENGIPLYLLMVLTRESLQHADAIWQFLLDQEVRGVAFNVEQAKAHNTTSGLAELEDAFDLCKRFFGRLRELQRHSPVTIDIREFDLFSNKMRHGPRGMPPFESRPLSIVSFDCDGNASTFSPELLDLRDARGNFHFASIADRDLSAILDNPRFQSIAAEVEEGIARCRETCRYFDVCGGGSPGNKLGEHGTFASAETMYCRLNVQAVIDNLSHDLFV